MSALVKAVARPIDAALEASVVGSFTKIGYAVRSRLDHWTDPPAVDGRTVVITGATSGLGLAMSERLAMLGANVHLVGRSAQKLEAASEAVARRANGSVATHECDLSSLTETTTLAQRLGGIGPIDVIVHNAGALLPTFTPTAEGVETTLAVHLLSPYLLTERLVADGALAPWARIIAMTSGGMYTERFDLATLEMGPAGYKGTVAYARAKRAQTILIAHWQHVYGPSRLAFHLVHPGWAATPGVSAGIPLFDKVMGPLLRSAEQGADTAVWLAGCADGEPEPAQLWLDRRPRSLHKLPRTRLSDEEVTAAESELPQWCALRITRAILGS